VSDSHTLFDRKVLAQRRRRAKAEGFLLAAAGEHLSERLALVNRALPEVLILGRQPSTLAFPRPPASTREFTLGEVEALPFAPNSFDAVVSAMELHWVNDLPGVLIQVRRILKPDGLFLAALPGGETLKELRACLIEAEGEVEGRASPRVAPFIDVRDAGDLLARAGFALPVADLETLRATYPDALALMAELRALGEANLMHERRKNFTRRGTLLRAVEIYQQRFAAGQGRVGATFQLLFLTAFAPGPDQPKPLRPGSGKVDLRQALGKTPGRG
jgi:NADH dehydrogenase [ubiquinone] 1 alpha subcomplex assembly factor 5